MAGGNGAGAELKDVGIGGVPVEVKRALVRLAKQERTSMGDAAVTLLARRFEIEYEPRRRPATTKVDPRKDKMVLRMPVGLDRAIEQAVLDEETTKSALVVRLLAEELEAAAA